MNNNTLTPTLAIVKSALALSAMTSPMETPMASTSVRDDVARLAATPSVERLRTTLAQCVVFQGLPPDALEDLVRRMTLRSGAAGTELLCPEEADAGLFIVVSGRVRVAVLGDTGREITLAVLKPGEFFGELSAIDGAPSGASVFANSEAQVANLSRAAFEEHLESWPRTARNLMEALARRLRRADETIADLALLDVEERLRRRLVRLAREEGDPMAEGVFLRRRPTQQELANMVGASRETVSRTFTVFVNRGLMELRGRGLMLLPGMFRPTNERGVAA